MEADLLDDSAALTEVRQFPDLRLARRLASPSQLVGDPGYPCSCRARPLSTALLVNIADQLSPARAPQ
jgi:hypothetical protein